MPAPGALSAPVKDRSDVPRGSDAPGHVACRARLAETPSRPNIPVLAVSTTSTAAQVAAIMPALERPRR